MSKIGKFLIGLSILIIMVLLTLILFEKNNPQKSTRVYNSSKYIIHVSPPYYDRFDAYEKLAKFSKQNNIKFLSSIKIDGKSMYEEPIFELGVFNSYEQASSITNKITKYLEYSSKIKKIE